MIVVEKGTLASGVESEIPLVDVVIWLAVVAREMLMGLISVRILPLIPLIVLDDG
jgi:hypothetical protein